MRPRESARAERTAFMGGMVRDDLHSASPWPLRAGEWHPHAATSRAVQRTWERLGAQRWVLGRSRWLVACPSRCLAVAGEDPSLRSEALPGALRLDFATTLRTRGISDRPPIVLTSVPRRSPAALVCLLRVTAQATLLLAQPMRGHRMLRGRASL